MGKSVGFCSISASNHDFPRKGSWRRFPFLQYLPRCYFLSSDLSDTPALLIDDSRLRSISSNIKLVAQHVRFNVR